MRLWHKDLIPVLPRLQLVSQWRECCCIAKSIAEKGTPNHILVNRIMNYPIDHFIYYSRFVADEMCMRGYKCDLSAFDKHGLKPVIKAYTFGGIFHMDLFEGWHNDRYLRECLYNLEEKAICKGIIQEEWSRIYERYGKQFDLWQGDMIE